MSSLESDHHTPEKHLVLMNYQTDRLKSLPVRIDHYLICNRCLRNKHLIQQFQKE